MAGKVGRGWPGGPDGDRQGGQLSGQLSGQTAAGGRGGNQSIWVAQWLAGRRWVVLQFQTSSKPVPNQFQTSSKPSSKPLSYCILMETALQACF